MNTVPETYGREIAHTPWGVANSIRLLADGIYSVSTPSHGGIKLSAERNSAIPSFMRLQSGWYEEDVEWARVAMIFPNVFEPADVVMAETVFKNWEPDSFERLFGRQLQPGESHKRDESLFQVAHANDLVATTAWGDWANWVPKGMVGVEAYVGGYDKHYRTHGSARYFLVSEEEYNARNPFGFIVDPARHQEAPEPK